MDINSEDNDMFNGVDNMSDESELDKLIPVKANNLPTGGRKYRDVQLDKGGEPNTCSVQDYREIMYGKDSEEYTSMKKKCENGEILCNECRDRLGKEIALFIEEEKSDE